MNIEHYATELITTLQSVIEELETIENGKNYTSDQAREKLYGILLSLEAEASDAEYFRKDT